MSRAIAWAIVGLVCWGVYALGSRWEPPVGLKTVPGVVGPFGSPVLQQMPSLPEGCRKQGGC